MVSLHDLRPAAGQRLSVRVDTGGGLADRIGWVLSWDGEWLELELRDGTRERIAAGSVRAARRVGVPLGRDPARAPRRLLDELAARAGLGGEPTVSRISELVGGTAAPAAVFPERGQWRDGRRRARVEGEWLTTNVTEPGLLVALAWWAARQDARSVQVRPEELS